MDTIKQVISGEKAPKGLASVSSKRKAENTELTNSVPLRVGTKPQKQD